jgi:hypothetical protein
LERRGRDERGGGGRVGGRDARDRRGEVRGDGRGDRRGDGRGDRRGRGGDRRDWRDGVEERRVELVRPATGVRIEFTGAAAIELIAREIHSMRGYTR